MRLRNVAQELVKLFDRPVSKGLGTAKLVAAPLGSVLRVRLDGGAEKVLVASWLSCRGGINSGISGGGRVSMYKDDPIQARSGSTGSTGAGER
jgi:hypothetical protein